MKKLPLPADITAALDESRPFILAAFYKQSLHDIMRARIPDDITWPHMVLGLDPWFEITKDHIRRYLIATGMKQDVATLHTAFQIADIEKIVKVTGWSYHDAWQRMSAFRFEGRIRGIDPGRPVEVGDIVKIERPSELEGKVESWILRVMRIDGGIASVQVIETANLANDCGFVRETLPVSCISNDWVREKFQLTVTRLRRKHEAASKSGRNRRTWGAGLKVAA